MGALAGTTVTTVTWAVEWGQTDDGNDERSKNAAMAGGARAGPPPRTAAARSLSRIPPLCRRTQVPSADRRAGTHRTGPARRRRRGARYAQRGGRDDEAVGRGDRLVAFAGSPAANGGHSSRSCRGPGRRSSDPRCAGCVRTGGAAPGDGVLGCAIRSRRATPGTSRRPVHLGGRTGGGTGSPAIFRRAAQRELAVDAANALELVRIYTVGHSTRSLDEFLSLLSAYEITLLEDIRVVAASRRYPHFVRDALAAALQEAGIDYRHVKDLGGWRRPRPDSPHTGWRSESFRGYADYMETPAFAAALEQVLADAQSHIVAIMCAEAVPWRCHRQLVADALLARGVEVVHILDRTHTELHRLTPFARIEGGRLVYDGAPAPRPLPERS